MENITVYARFKSSKEKTDTKSTNFIVDSKKITNKKTKEVYNFDNIINQSSPIKDTFKKLLKQNISLLLKGINISIFSYGQSDSEKILFFNGDQKSNEALIHLSIKELFNLLGINKTTQIKKYIVKISYIQIYNEEIYDLLNGMTNKKINITDISDVIVNNYEEATDIINKGETNKCNDNSYSHYIIKINIEYNNENNKDKKYDTSMTFVELAGSENILKSKHKEKEKEIDNTNKSLLCFNNMINKLYKNNARFINYKESKLTCLLQNMFNGNKKNKIIFFCSMIDDVNNYNETANTLNFSKKLKSIKLSNININNKNKYKENQANENKALRNKIKFLEKMIKDKKTLKEKNNIKNNKFKNNIQNENNDIINNKQIKNLEKEIALLKKYLLYNNANEEYNSDLKSNIDFFDYTDYTSEQGFNEIYNTSIKPRFNLSSIRGSESILKSPYFSSPFSNTKNIINELQGGNKNNFQKNLCMTEMRPETHNFFLNNSAMGKTEPPIFNFNENQNMNISFPDLNSNCIINSGNKNNYLIKENEELKKNIDEIKKTYNDIMKSKEEEINLINQSHDIALENCEKIIKDAENSYIILKSDYDKALETIKKKENELNNLKQENMNQNSSIKFYQKQLDKIGDFEYANEIESKYNELLEENRELKEKGDKIKIKLKEENELLKQNIDMIENKYKEKCKELINNKKLINENNKLHEKELQKYKIEMKNYKAISNKNKNINTNINANNVNNEDDKFKEYENKISELMQENTEYKNSLEIIEKTQINEYQKLLDESFAKIAELNKELNGTKDKNKYLEETLNLFENKKNRDLLNKKRKKENLNDISMKTPKKDNKENKNILNRIFSDFEI